MQLHTSVSRKSPNNSPRETLSQKPSRPKVDHIFDFQAGQAFSKSVSRKFVSYTILAYLTQII